jgi:hypothetical protein
MFQINFLGNYNIFKNCRFYFLVLLISVPCAAGKNYETKVLEITWCSLSKWCFFINHNAEQKGLLERCQNCLLYLRSYDSTFQHVVWKPTTAQLRIAGLQTGLKYVYRNIPMTFCNIVLSPKNLCTSRNLCKNQIPFASSKSFKPLYPDMERPAKFIKA